MTTFVALLRGINVSGHNSIQMPALKSLFEGLGFSNVRTYLQSGNVVFDSHPDDWTALSTAIPDEIEKVLGLRLPVIIRSAKEMETLLDGNPFINERNLDPAGLYVTFLQYPTNPIFAVALAAPAGVGEDEFVLCGMDIYVSCPGGYGRTKLNNNFFENKLKLAASTRNWKTVQAMVEMSKEG
ncbi:MAG: DUF1697 domain-containing protein [Anaerolineaceae bacterium]